jgi:sugar phosphate isomerase/epimerase
MLLTLSTRSLHALLTGKEPELHLYDAPKYVLGEFALHGLALQTSYLAGWDANALDRLRDEADRAGCPWLTLIEDRSHDFTTPTKANNAIDRLERVLRVGHRLGCASVAMRIQAPASADADQIAGRLKEVVTAAERLEVNLLLAPEPGLTETPEQLTGMIRKVGGFRIGSMPDFQTAAATDDPSGYMRQLTPYASCVCAAVTDFDNAGAHKAFPLEGCMEAVKTVGYEGALAIEYRGDNAPGPAIEAAKRFLTASLEEET